MDSITLIMKGLEYSAKLRKTMIRKDGITPYVNRSISVAVNLALGGAVHDPVVIVAALLYDQIEDCDITLEKVEKEFGSRVAVILHEVTEDKNAWRYDRMPHKRALQIFTYTTISNDARQIKLANILYNFNEVIARPPAGWDIGRMQSYADWIKKLLDSGLRNSNTHIEKLIDALIAKYEKPKEKFKDKGTEEKIVKEKAKEKPKEIVEKVKKPSEQKEAKEGKEARSTMEVEHLSAQVDGQIDDTPKVGARKKTDERVRSCLSKKDGEQYIQNSYKKDNNENSFHSRRDYNTG